jgi:hypothetical protein
VAALKQINNSKAPGIDNIVPEVLKTDINTVTVSYREDTA